MIADARAAGLASGSNPARRLASRPEMVRALGVYRDKVLALARLGVGFEPCGRDDLFDAAFGFQRRYGLLTNDSVLLAVALRLKADALATADEALAAVTEISVYRPSDVTAGA
jgi:predicted nucleic acid-binding protein